MININDHLFGLRPRTIIIICEIFSSTFIIVITNTFININSVIWWSSHNSMLIVKSKTVTRFMENNLNKTCLMIVSHIGIVVLG